MAPDRLNFGLTWDPIRAASLFAQAYVVSSQFEAVGFPRNRAYHHIDIGGVYHIITKHGAWPALDLLARINNVTDERYMEVLGFRALGIGRNANAAVPRPAGGPPPTAVVRLVRHGRPLGRRGP